MRISPAWLREFVDVPADDRQLAEELTQAGIAVESVDEQAGQPVYEMDITTNRVDAMNHYGVAREASAIYDIDLKPISPSLPKPRGQANFAIEIEDSLGCARYVARVVREVKIGPSPAPIAKRLELMGSRSINNAADATNYTLFEIGHPTHVFDLDLLEGGKIIVRRARDGETLKTLDGVDRKLSREDLVIADVRKPVALAGVMGGFDTMITDKTRNILIESAWFDPASVRATAKRLGMHTDASHRFERGADINSAPVGCDRVAQLLIETAAGHVEGDAIDAYPRKHQPAQLQLRRSEVVRILGLDIPEREVQRIMRRLGFGLTAGRSVPASKPVAPSGSGGTHAAVAEEPASYSVTVPSWRLDVEREVDLLEELARVYGYNRFPNTLPEFSGSVVELPEVARDARLHESLLALGYNEAISVTFISHADAQAFSGAVPVEIANPLNEEASVMRPSLVPSMLNMLAWNLNRGVSDVRLFEAGHIYERLGERTQEHKRIAIGATGNAQPASVHGPARPYMFFDLKGDIEQLLGLFEHKSLYFDDHSADFFHPGRSARAVMDGSTVARFGQLHPDVAAARKLKQDVYVAEIYLERLYQHELREIRYQPIPRFPAVERDFSFIFDDAINFERIRSVVDALHLTELRDFKPVEIFRGGTVPAGKYSVLLRATFQSAERTLRDDEVALWSTQIVKALEAIGGSQRT